MKKRSVALLTVAVCAVSLFAGVAASEVISEIRAELRRDFTVVVDNEERAFKNAQGETVYPVLYEGTTYLPLRAIGELMGKKVFWYENDKTVELKNVTVTDADVIVSGEQKTENANSDNTKFIDVDKAKEIALEKAGYTADRVKFERTELDEDDGIYHYEIEFITGGVEYDFDIGAVNGAVLSWEIDNYDDDDDNTAPVTTEFISKDRAKEIALGKAGIAADGVIFEEFELDEDDGVYHYEIEFKKERTEYKIDIKADDGTILKWEVDKD